MPDFPTPHCCVQAEARKEGVKIRLEADPPGQEGAVHGGGAKLKRTSHGALRLGGQQPPVFTCLHLRAFTGTCDAASAHAA